MQATNQYDKQLVKCSAEIAVSARLKKRVSDELQKQLFTAIERVGASWPAQENISKGDMSTLFYLFGVLLIEASHARKLEDKREIEAAAWELYEKVLSALNFPGKGIEF